MNTHPKHGYRYHNPAHHDNVLYTAETHPAVALGVLATAARSEGWKAPERYTQITPWYHDDIARVPISGRAGRTMYHD